MRSPMSRRPTRLDRDQDKEPFLKPRRIAVSTAIGVSKSPCGHNAPVAGDHARTGGEADAASETPGQTTHHPDHVVDIRDQGPDSREREAEARDARAEARDARAEARDDRSEARDDRAELREHAAGRTDA